MMSRTRLLITAALACHLLLAPSIVTSQLPPQSVSTPQSLPNVPSAPKEEDVTIVATQQEKQGSIYKLEGNAAIRYGVYVLRADKITYDADTGIARAEGQVSLEGGPYEEHIKAISGEYNVRAETGRFEDVTGTIGIRVHGIQAMSISDSAFYFRAKVVEKTGPYHYRINDGMVTTCPMPHPKWQFSVHQVEVEVGGTAKLYHSDFAIRSVPILYLPFATLPAERLPRQSGFLIPNLGTSSVKGLILGESLFWAINRSMDAHIGAEYYSKRGWAPQGEFRWRPSETAFLDATYFGVLDRGVGSPPVNQGGEEVRLTGEGKLGHSFRAVADVDYLSSFLFRLAFSEVFTQAVNSEVKSAAFLSDTSGGYFYNASLHRYQDFESSTPGDVISILHAPSFESSSALHKLGPSPFYWSYDAAIEGLSRSEPTFSTGTLLGRFDFHPTLSLPVQLKGWSFRPDVSVRDTSYTEQLETSDNGTRTSVSSAINRKSLEGSVEVRPPVLDRVFKRQFLGRKWKHAIEPRVVYNYVTGVDNFSNILRFDGRDILSNTNEVEYSVVNRLYSKKDFEALNCAEPGMPSLFLGGPSQHSTIPWERQGQMAEAQCDSVSGPREVVTWELAQKYFVDPTFGGALIEGRSNVLTSTVDLTGIAFLDSPRHLSPLISRLRIAPNASTDVEWDMDYDFQLGHMSASTVLVNYHFGRYTIGGGDAYLEVPPESPSATGAPSPQSFNQLRLLMGYGFTGKPGFSAAANIGFDADLGFLQYAAVQTTYNWNCCGISLEFRRFALGSVRNENQYRFTFALANFATLGNLRRADRLF